MMKNENSNIKKLLFYALMMCLIMAVVLLVNPEQIFAQPGLPNDPEQTPIDGGLGILAALGGTYAIKKLREKE